MTTYTLTTNTDNFVGGLGKDAFKGTYNDGATGTWGLLDALNGGAGFDTLSINPIGTAAITPDDRYWSHVSHIEKVVINTTGPGAQTLTTGAFFEAAFAGAGVVLKTTSGAGAITVDMSSFTGTATLTTITTGGAQALTMGTGLATVTAKSGAGALTINGAGLTSVLAITTGAGAQTLGDGSGGGAHLVTVTATSIGGAQTITSTSTHAVTVQAHSTAGVQTILTGAGADMINAATTAAINTIATGEGDDTVNIAATATGGYNINGGLGNDIINGGAGNDSIAGGDGDDKLDGGAGNDTLTGGLGDDVLNGGTGVDSMTGGNGSDLYVVDNASDIIIESNADASMGGIDRVYSYLGAYTLVANLENGLIMSTDAANLTGNNLDNLLYAGAGDNVLDGRQGSDTALYTYAGSAVTVNLAVTGSQNTLGSGLDTLISIENLLGSDYNDTLTGNAGGNILNGGLGADTLIGGDGNDRYTADNSGDVIIETNATKAGGIDIVYSDLSAYTLGTNIENGRVNATNAANLTGNSLNNVLYAGVGDNVLNGGLGIDTASYLYASSAVTVSLAVTSTQNTLGSGSDTLIGIERLTGSDYNDTLTGNAKVNVLTGGMGADTLTGGGGKDIFDFNALSDMGALSGNADIITDFVRGQDKIDLSTLDANTATTANDGFSGFIDNTTSFSAAGQLMFLDGVLYGSTNTDSSAEFAIQLTGITALDNSDIHL